MAYPYIRPIGPVSDVCFCRSGWHSRIQASRKLRGSIFIDESIQEGLIAYLRVRGCGIRNVHFFDSHNATHFPEEGMKERLWGRQYLYGSHALFFHRIALLLMMMMMMMMMMMRLNHAQFWNASCFGLLLFSWHRREEFVDLPITSCSIHCYFYNAIFPNS